MKTKPLHLLVLGPNYHVSILYLPLSWPWPVVVSNIPVHSIYRWVLCSSTVTVNGLKIYKEQ